jgi:hypothetical protein
MTKHPNVTPLRDEDHVAAVLNVGKSTVSKMRLTGTGPAYVKMGALVRYTDEAIAEYVESCRQQSTAENRERAKAGAS